MLRPSYTSVVERRKQIDGVFHSHPYEAAWALEAIFFVAVENTPHPSIEATVEISPDGLHWTCKGETIIIGPEDELVAIPTDHFGHWLRVTLAGAAEKDPAAATIYLVLKG